MKCDLYKTRKRVVMGRGDLNCDVLFIGEAPGKNEDALGTPFIGQAGKLLEQSIDLALKWAELPPKRPRIFITNSCACRPTDEIGGDNRPPTKEELWACFPRLEHECKLANPKRVVLLGKVAESAAISLYPDALKLQHPAYILRAGGWGGPAHQKFVRELSNLFRRMKDGEEAEEPRAKGSAVNSSGGARDAVPAKQAEKPRRIFSRSGDHPVDSVPFHPMSGCNAALPRRLEIDRGAESDLVRKSDARPHRKLVRAFHRIAGDRPRP
jgi:uracil-DNA glycosylase family 4